MEDFDVDQMWNAFELKSAPTRIRRIRPWYMMVAAVAVVLLGVAMLMNGSNYLNNTKAISQDDLVYQKLTEIDPDLAAEQVSILSIVIQQDSLIKNLGITETQFPELFKEIAYLDSLQMEYLNDIDNYRDRKNLTRTLLRHYQRKARVLELMLYEFEKQESESEYGKDKQI